jgi:ArsR family transcriptional regulator, arsenate/arsenite/antimonite-responsive transcriptional repressor
MEKNVVIAGLGALAQETRLDIVRYLVRKGVEGAIAGDVGSHVRVPSARLAFSSQYPLTGARLLMRRRSGRNIIYRVDFGRLHNITAYLLENCRTTPGKQPRARNQGRRASQ